MNEKEMTETCKCCGSEEGLKRGWTNSFYCSYNCELGDVSALHASMPGGKLPHPQWVPDHIGTEIRKRWEDES